jgi:hypothetical protein
MGRKLAGIAVLAALALALLAGCNMVGEQWNAIIGSIFLDPATEQMWGGAEFHVLVYEATESVNPSDASTVNELLTVARLDDTFPGTMVDWYWATNYLITDVPAGEYFVFVWIDRDDNGEFLQGDDAFGFYDANASGTAILEEPVSPNVVVPATGFLDIDVGCGYPEV